MRDQVRRFLALNEGVVRYLAARLLRDGMLTGDEVERVVRGTLGRPLVRLRHW